MITNIIVNPHFFNMETWYIVVACIYGAPAVIAIDGLLAFLIRRLPEKWFLWNSKLFKVSKGETKFYEKLGIKKWKDHVVELGMFTNFHKDKIANPRDPVYMERFLMESNYGVAIHLSNVILGYLVIFCYPLKYVLCFGVPVAFVNGFLSLLPLLILRYNTPKLQSLHTILLKKQNSTKENPENKV